jgi:hypothetical protein
MRAQSLIWISLLLAFGLGTLISSFMGGAERSALELESSDMADEEFEFVVPDVKPTSDPIPPPLPPP